MVVKVSLGLSLGQEAGWGLVCELPEILLLCQHRAGPGDPLPVRRLVRFSGCCLAASWQHCPCLLFIAPGLPFVALSACLGDEGRGSCAGLLAIFSGTPWLLLGGRPSGKMVICKDHLLIWCLEELMLASSLGSGLCILIVFEFPLPCAVVCTCGHVT